MKTGAVAGNIYLKVDSNEKRGVRKETVNQLLSGIVAIGQDQCPIRSALPIQDMNIHNTNSIGRITCQRRYIGADIFIS